MKNLRTRKAAREKVRIYSGSIITQRFFLGNLFCASIKEIFYFIF